VVKVLERLVLVRDYQGSMGVVTPFRGQANRIRQLVRQNSALDAALNRRNFMVETAHGFQGDERDVMIFSPVVSANTTQGALEHFK
jgi:superfamily I DNA and/or RNA helicase